jgi:hypothetical protein
MEQVANYGQVGVGSDVELGKGGAHVKSDADKIEARNAAGNLTPVKGADATATDEFVTKSQMDTATQSSYTSDMVNIVFGNTGTPVETSVDVPANARVVEAIVKVTAAFNGTTPKLELGTSAASSTNIDNGDGSKITATGTYIINGLVAGEAGKLRATLTATGATTGAATVAFRWVADN